MTLFLTAVALMAFAANSLLCRLALGSGALDPITFTTLRLVSGVLILVPISRFMHEPKGMIRTGNAWKSGLALFSYAAAFSLGYVSLSAGMGTLILVGAVQLTMLGWALMCGERLNLLRWAGSVLSFGGLVYLVLPGVSAPDPVGALLMLTAGVAWGIYSIRGKGAWAPVAMTTHNFLWAAPIALFVSLLLYSTHHVEIKGVILAVCSGAITSGLGYVVWYRALRHLSTSAASLVQLMVPVLAAWGGIVFLNEQLAARFVIASVLILGGVAIGLYRRKS